MTATRTNYLHLIGVSLVSIAVLSCSGDKPTSRGPDGVVFEKAIGGMGSDGGSSVTIASDDGYVIAGSTTSSGLGSADIYLLKTDLHGDTIWSRTYGGTDSDFALAITLTSDGGYLATGQTASFGAGSNDLYLIRVDSLGNFIWSKTYGGVDLDIGTSARETLDGGFIVTGYTSSFGAGETDVYLVKIDINGNFVWSKTFGGPGIERGQSVTEVSDGGYLVAGQAADSVGNGYDIYLVRTDVNGDSLWTKRFGGIESDVGNSVFESFRGEYIIAGTTRSFGAGLTDVYLIASDKNGDTLWTSTFGGPGNEQGLSVESSTNGSYIITGHTDIDGSSPSDLYLVKADINGSFVWARRFGGSGADAGTSVRSTRDGGYIVTGRTNVSSLNGTDVYLIKTDADGHVR